MSVEALPTMKEVFIGVVREACNSLHISPAALETSGNRSHAAITARGIVIKRMYDLGFSPAIIGGFLKINTSAVWYHLATPERRAQVNEQRKKSRRTARA